MKNQITFLQKKTIKRKSKFNIEKVPPNHFLNQIIETEEQAFNLWKLSGGQQMPQSPQKSYGIHIGARNRRNPDRPSTYLFDFDLGRKNIIEKLNELSMRSTIAKRTLLSSIFFNSLFFLIK